MSESNTQVAVREPHYERVGIASIGSGGGMPAVQSMAEAVSIAQLMAKSGIAIRKHLRDNPGACLGVLMQALRWEFDPYMVGNKSYAVNDQLAYEAQLLAAVVLTRSSIVDEPDYTYEGEPFKTRTCTVSFKMRSGKTLTYTTPETGKISPKNSPLWKTDEDQQLGYYAIRAWARRHQPHVLLGCYTPEEASETMMVDVTPVKTDLVGKLSAGVKEAAGFNRDSIAENMGDETKPRRKKASPDAAGAVPEPGEAMHATPAAGTPAEAAAEALGGDDAGRDKGYKVYGDHAPVGQPALASNAEPLEDTDLPPEFNAYIDALEVANTFAEVKTALMAFQKTPVWAGMTEEVANRTRANSWFTLAEERKVEWLPNPKADVSAYRLWVETEGDAATVQATFDALSATEAFEAASDAARSNIIRATAARVDYLKG